METITDLIKGVSVPRMVKIREVFDDTHIPVNMIADMVNAELSREALGGQVKPGMRIAITCGSRGHCYDLRNHTIHPYPPHLHCHPVSGSCRSGTAHHTVCVQPR